MSGNFTEGSKGSKGFNPFALLPSVQILIFLALLSSGRATQVAKETDSLGRDYYLFTPDKIDPSTTYWLAVEVHGYGGAGSARSGVRAWVEHEDCIGVSPSFPNEGYQVLAKDSDRQLVGIFQTLKQNYKLHDKLFIYGHSGGAQFAHRFTSKYPDLVAACCATSAGSWATGTTYDSLNQAASGVPIAISCGEKDGKSLPNSPMTRYEWAKKFEEELARRHFFYKASYWPNVAHEGDPAGNAELAYEAFSLGTTGMVGLDREGFEAKMEILNNQVRTGDFAHAITGGGILLNDTKQRGSRETANNLAASRWNASAPAVDVCTEAAKKFVAGRLQKLSNDVQNAALAEVATREKQSDPESVIRLRALYNTFAQWPKVRTAITQAMLRMHAKVQ